MDTLGGSVIPILVITVLTLTITKQSLAEELLCSDHDFYLEFPSNQPSVKIDGDTDLEAFTICLWLSTSVASKLGIVRYSDQSTSDVLIGLSLSDNGHLYFSLGGEDRQLQVLPGVQAGDWHGLCVTWQKEDGFFMVYYDGRLLLTGSDFNTGNPVLSKGIFTLGIGSQNHLYEGKLGHVNAWPLVLDHPHLAVLSSKCGVERGELVSWPEFREGTNVISAVEGAACPLTETDVTNELKHWRLDGSDEELSPQYSASFVEGRLDDHKAVYLDQTMAYLEAPFVNLSTTFTIACWVKLLPSNPYLKPILFSENGGSFWFGVDTDNKLLFENSIGASSLRVEVDDPLHEKQWLHVAVSLTTSSELIFYINGLKRLSTAAHSWQSPDSGPLAIGKVNSTSDGEYIYLHGFLSDLYMYSRALSAEEIGKIMGRSSPCTFSEWSSHPMLTPGQKPTENRRAKSCPGVGQCTEVRAWKAADCREVLLAGNKISGVYTISPLNIEDEFDVFCDQETQGGGWTIIQQRNNGSLSFSKTWGEYKAGFGTVGGQSEMWLGNDKIHNLATKNSELLIQLEAFDGSKGFSIYSDFHVAGESDKYRLSLGNFSGNLPDKLGTHNNSNFTVGTCADLQGVGWWFSSSCGEVLLNSQYGQNTGIMKWNDFPNLGDAGGKLMKTIMKIRRTEAYTGDYTLIFGKDASSSSMILWPTILTEFKAFTLCLWHKLYVQRKDKGLTMTLLRYFVDDGNFTLTIKDFEDEDGPMLSLITWPSTEKQRAGVKFPAPDGSWHHLCVSWTNDGGVATAYMDGNRTSFLSTTGDGVTFSGGGRLIFGAVQAKNSRNLEGEVTHVNLWDKVLPEASIQSIAHSCQSEKGNLLQWHFFAAMAVGAVQYVPHASACFTKEMYHWNFHHSSTTQSIDLNKNHIAKLTDARISDYQKSLVIEDRGHFVAENISSDLSEDQGFTVSFSVKQTVMSSDILKDDFKSLEALRSAFPTFIRDYAMWKRCYSADHSSWNTAEFHSNCDSKGPSLTIIRVREYVFGGFVEQSWGGTAQDIGHQFEGFLFSLSNPSGQSSQFFPIQLGKTSARTDPQLGPSFGQRDLELFQEESGRLMGFSRLGASFNVTNISLSSSEARNYFAGSQQFYPDQVEVFYYHVPSTPLGLENQAIPDGNFNSSSVSNATTGPHLARLNELRDSRAWCSSGATANEWLHVFLGKQYTLTYIALQGIGGGYDVTALTVKYEQTHNGLNWITYSKLADGSEASKVLQFNLVTAGAVVKESFFPPFQAVKLRIILTEQKVLCLKMELYFYDAGCSLAYGLEDRTIPDERLTASSTIDAETNNKYWPLRGRLNNNAGSHVWGPYKRSGEFGTVGDWFQVDLEQEQEIKCIATQGRQTHKQWLTNYQIAYSSEGNDWKFYEENDGEVKEFDANSDQSMAVTNWFVPSFYGRFIRVRVTGINNYCRLRMELYGKSTNLTEILSFQNGLAFTVRRGRYDIFFGKENSFWQIRHPLIVNQWFDATLTWTPDDGLKFYVNGKLVASDTTPEQLNLPLASEPFKLMIGSAENGGGWSRAISIHELKVWKMAMKEEEVKRKYEVYLDFDDNSRDWALLLNSSSGWKLSHGCTETAGTGPCDDVSGGGRYIHFDASQPEESARFVTPSNVNLYTCLKFYYHMEGAHIGRLNIYSTSLYGNEELLWRLYGNQNDTWNEAHIPVNVNHPQYQVIFEAVKGSSYLGDIAIDQIKFTREECSLFPSSAAPQDLAGSGIVIDSLIVPMDSIYHQYLSLMLKEEGHDSSRWTPCYRALDHGWNVSTFHQKCGNKGPTLSIVRKENFVFGGFTERSWGEDEMDSNFELNFWRLDVSDYVWVDGSSSISQFTASMWIKISGSYPFTLFSFGSVAVMIHFYIERSDRTHLCIWDGSNRLCSLITLTQSYLTDGSWRHLTVTWCNSVEWTLSLDGQLLGSKTEYTWSSFSNIPVGTLLIGQNQHPINFSIPGSFQGQITAFNMWNHKMDDSEIAMLAQSCVNIPGNVFRWSTFKNNVHGALKLVKPSTCQQSYDVHFWRQNKDDYIRSNSSSASSMTSFTVSFWIMSSLQNFQIAFSFISTEVVVEFEINNSGAPGICFVLDNNQAAANCSYIDSPSSKLNDGFWHQIVAVWSGIDKSWIASIDGVSQERQSHPSWTTDSIPTAATLMIGQLPPSLSGDSSKSFLGRITLFNMWDHTREASELAMLARGCRNDPGNLFSWNTLKSSASYGQLKIIEPSSCCSTYYRSDNKAFIFSLNYTSEGSLFKKKISEQYAATAIYSSPSTGPTFGQAPFDFQIGDSDNMKTGSSHHVISYEGGGSNAGTNLETVLAGASTFEPSDVEVLYKVHGAKQEREMTKFCVLYGTRTTTTSLCTQHCPFNHHCDEINGDCRCNTEDEDPALCQIFQIYKDSSHFWPLDSVEEIKDLATPGWGKANGGVSEVFGITTDGVSGEIHLNHEGDTCATKTANYSCGDAGFTVSLFIKPENRADGLQKTFFKSLGKFVVYQEANSKSLIVRVQRATEYCLKEISMPEKIWSHLAFKYDASSPQTLTVYRNGQRIDKFIRDEGCNKAGIPEFSSSSVLLGGGDSVYAKASYFHMAIWKQVLPEESIAQLFHATKYLVPFSVHVVAQIENIPWHEDLTSPETERYTLTTNDIKSNVTGFYSNFSGILISVEVHGYRSGSVIAGFTITFNDSNFDLIQELNESVSSTGYLYNMPLKIQQLTPRNVPYESPTNLSVASASDTYLAITWDDPSLPPEIWNIFQGYEVYIRRYGTTQFNVTQINEQVNFVTLSGLEPLVTYEMSIAAYTLTGVGKKSDIISVNTTFVAPPENISVVSVTYSCVTIQWNDVAPERFGLFVGYVVHYDFFYQSSFSMYKQTSPASIHEVEICGLQPSSTYKFYVRRELLESKLGNGSAIQLFTTLEAPIRVPPTNVTAYNTSSTSIMVQWQAPAIPVGVQLCGYQVFFKPRLNATSHWGSKITCNSTLNVTLKSLQKYTDYEIMVSAFNSLGLGNSSEVATSFTDEDIPLAGPVIISANYTSSTSINISWSPVPEPLRLGIITKYIFNLTDVLTGVVTTAEFHGANLHGEATNLSKYREYSITGAAANSKGQSNFTSTVTCRTDEDAPDLPPANVTAYNASSTAITVEFQAYSPEQLNGILRKYVFKILKAKVVNSPHWIYTIPIHHSRRRRAASGDSVIQNTLSWLEEYTVYSIQASVFTNKQGPYSAVLNVSTDEGVPRAPPLQLTAFNTSNSSILVTWQDITSSSVPGILLGYVLRIIKADDSNASNFREIEHDLSTSKNITNLETYTLYKISVAGYTRVGIGNFSEAQSWTDEGVPLGPPNNLTRSSTTTSSITLSWIPVKKELRKGIIQGHEAKIFNDNGVLLDGTTVYGSSLSAYFDGLDVYSNYTVQVRAFTRKGFGPWSPLVRVSTGAPIPEQTPMNATARATGSYTINVTWSAISVIDAWSIFGYRVLYFPISNPGQLRDITTGRDEIQATITGLRPFTLYGIQIAAYSTEDGNYTTPVYAQTWQAAPSAPPSRFGVTARDSQSLLVYWLDVPPEHQNGIIRGYRIAYRSSSNGTATVITRRAYSEVLTQLQKATEYTIQVWAFTDAGDGVSASYTTWTAEDVPSRPPSNITAQNRTSLTSIPIFWEPFPQEYTHGRLVGYRVTFQAVSIGDLPVEFEPVITKDVGNAVTSMILRNLKPLVVYRITVAAISNKGPGPAGITFGETCRCRPHLTTNWRNYPPYVNVTFLSTPGIIIPKLLTGVISECCGECLDHGQSKLDFTQNGNNGTAQQNSSEDLLQNIDGQTDFSFPVIGYKLQDSYKGGLGYAPFVESAGIAFVVYTDNSAVKDAMFDALIACWPVVVLPVVMAYIAGVLVWLLDTKSNSQHFPTSYVQGTWEGIWWSFVSMTTVGYGDRTPMSHLGRIFAVGWVLVGLVIISVTMGALTTALTTITSVSETRIYGSRIGAIQGSPEYNLGVRRNALMNEAKHYHTLEDLSEALLNREVDGILIDTYAGGTQRDLFSKPSVRVARVIDHQTAYGVVIGGDSMRLRHCFYGYMRSHQAEIFKWVEQLVEPIKGSGLSDEEIVQDISTGLFDSNADLFHSTLLITSTCAVTGVVLGLVYELVRRIRARQKVEHDNTLLTDKDKIIEEMRKIMDEFFQQTIKSLKKMKAKHKKELLKYARFAPTRSEKRTSMLTNSSFINSRNNLNEDDISVIELEDLRLNSAKC